MTYKKIQEYIKIKYGFVVKTCWIAHAKELYGLPVNTSANRKTNQRKYPCPADKLDIIAKAFQYFGFLEK